MDKRTFFFVIATTFTLFAVNVFFQWLNQDEVAKWHAEQKALLEQERAELSVEIDQRTAKASDLPIVKVYLADSDQFVTNGVSVNGGVLALSWAPQLPETVRVDGSDIQLAHAPEQLDALAIYRKGSEPVPVASLPPYGEHELQVLMPNGQIILADYTDGALSIPLEKVEQATIDSNGIALMKEDGKYAPVGVFVHQERRVVPFAQIPNISSFIALPKVDRVEKKIEGKEEFFVLESDYQQLVFSNVGGALAEINLPFRSEENERSVVKEIAFDREMVRSHPYNARFPQHAYMTHGFEKHDEGKLGGYYPLIRRNLVEANPAKSVVIPPEYYALNIVSEYPEVSQLIYEVTSFTKDTIVFEASQVHRKIIKTYSIAKQKEGAPYCIDVEVRIEGDSRGLGVSSGVPEVEWISNAPAPALKYRLFRNNKSEINEISLPKDSTTVTTVNPNWIVTSNGFFGIILDPQSKIEPGYRVQYVDGTLVPSRLVEIDQKYDLFKAEKMPGYMAQLPLKGPNGVLKFRVFAGPFSDKILRTIDATFKDPKTGVTPDYVNVQSFHGWFSFISEPFAKFLFILMSFFHKLTNSWGLSIILLTIALRVMLYPLNAWFTRSTLKMQEIQPKVQAIQEKYKNDPNKLRLEVMNVYRESGANPLSGCFPMIIQIPFLMGMFGLLKTTFALRGASFIPGWIDDLSAPDVLFSWSQPIYFIGTEFHLLPVILGLTMLIQPRLAARGKDVSQMTEQQRQARAMGNIMAIVFTLLFYNFPSGLNIYWLFSTLLAMLQQWWMQKMKKPSDVIEAKVTKPKKKKK